MSFLVLFLLFPSLALPLIFAWDTSGCSVPHAFHGIPKYHSLHIPFDNASSPSSPYPSATSKLRKFSVHLPEPYIASHQYPVIVGFHGNTRNGLCFEVDTKLDEPRYTADKIMVYPDGYNSSWAGASYAATSVHEELDFVDSMLAFVRSEYCIDSSRIYATGHSNGGGFVSTLACNDTVGGQFAAFAAGSGAFYTDINGTQDPSREGGYACTPARSLTPMLEFHGVLDETIHYDGGRGAGGRVPSVEQWLTYWAERNSCETDFTQTDSFNGSVHHLSWTCQGVEGGLQHYRVDRMRHSWPAPLPNLSQLAADDEPVPIDASAIVQQFFDGHTTSRMD